MSLNININFSSLNKAVERIFSTQLSIYRSSYCYKPVFHSKTSSLYHSSLKSIAKYFHLCTYSYLILFHKFMLVFIIAFIYLSKSFLYSFIYSVIYPFIFVHSFMFMNFHSCIHVIIILHIFLFISYV